MEEETVASVPGWKVPPQQKKRRSVKDIGATKGGLHVDCPVCGERITVDARGGRASLMHRLDNEINRMAGDRVQAWLTNAWGVKSRARRTDSSKEKLSTSTIDRIFMSGTGHFLRMCWKEAKRKAYRVWFAVAWHKVDSIGQNLFVCPMEELPTVIGALCDSSAEFAKRIEQRAKFSLAGRSPSDVGNKAKDAAKLADDAVPVMDPLTARLVEGS